MPAEQRRSLRRSGSIGAFGLVCLACLVPVSSAADAPTPDAPPLAVAPDPQPSQPVVVAPRRPRRAPVVARGPAAPSIVPAPAAKKLAPAVVRRPVVKERATRAAKKPVQASSPGRSAPPVPSSVRRDVWQLPRGAFVVAAAQAEPLERRRFALAGVALALVAVGGGVILGVGGRTLKEATA